jgi:hypothetical protein
MIVNKLDKLVDVMGVELVGRLSVALELVVVCDTA